MQAARSLLALALSSWTAACAAPQPIVEPPAPVAVRLRDAGARVWMGASATGKGVNLLELVVARTAPKPSCPSPLRVCSAASVVTQEPAAATTLTFHRDDEGGAPECTATGLREAIGVFDCEEGLDRDIELVRKGDSYVVRLLGHWWLGTLDEMERVFQVSVREHPTFASQFLLAPASPIALAFGAGRKLEGAAETHHLQPLVEPFVNAGGALPEVSVQALEALVVEHGFDPSTLPLATARSIRADVDGVSIPLLGMTATKRRALVRELVAARIEALRLDLEAH